MSFLGGVFKYMGEFLHVQCMIRRLKIVSTCWFGKKAKVWFHLTHALWDRKNCPSICLELSLFHSKQEVMSNEARNHSMLISTALPEVIQPRDLGLEQQSPGG